MKIVFFGATKFSEDILNSLFENRLDVSAVFTIPAVFEISYSKTPVKNSNYSNLTEFCEKRNIKCFSVNSSKIGTKTIEYYDEIAKINPDIILVMGWYFMVPKKIRELASFGVWGIHASMLPKYAGGAPLVWAIIKGEKETGVTLFRLADGVDDGDIIDQVSFSIDYQDSIKEVYEKATRASIDILVKSLKKIDSITFTPQNKEEINIFPQRNPNDGEIDMSKSADEIYNFIRAQSNPYPGAFFRTEDGKKIIIEKARVEN